MILILLGPPGGGKGTQAVKLFEKYGLIQISTGDILRSEIKKGSGLGKEANQYVSKGLLVPDDIMIRIIEKRIADDDCKNGFILDGFPRTIPQAKALDELLEKLAKKIDKVISMIVSENFLIERLTGRRLCSKCGAGYHIKYSPPKVQGKCDTCGGELIQREDDKEETIKKRFSVYQDQTTPLIEYYQKKSILREVNGEGDVESVYRLIVSIIEE